MLGANDLAIMIMQYFIRIKFDAFPNGIYYSNARTYIYNTKVPTHRD